jgi:hypothetical protein
MIAIHVRLPGRFQADEIEHPRIQQMRWNDVLQAAEQIFYASGKAPFPIGQHQLHLFAL